MRKSYLAVVVVTGIVALAGFAWWRITPTQSIGDQRALSIFGTTDDALMRPVLAEYRLRHPRTRLSYVEMDGSALYQRVLSDLQAHRPGPDLVISTAMDLQIRLVNDGQTVPHISTNASALPPWARWRDEAFGVAFEPAVMVFNRKLMAGRLIPRSRSELLDAIGGDLDFWRGRVGTYDIRRSGTGYLLMSQDSRQASDSGALFKSFGMAQVKLAGQSSVLLRQVARGEIAVAYNVLSSYARRLKVSGAPIEIVYPRDFTLALLHTAVIPRNAEHPQAAHEFLEFLLAPEGQRALSEPAGLSAIREDSLSGGADIAQTGIVRPIPLGPGLLVYLDAHKRKRLLDNWDNLIAEPPG